MSNDSTDLEKKYRATFDEVNPKIQEHLDKASKSLMKACELADEFGVPFYTGVSFLSQHYIPEDLTSKTGLTASELESITDISDYAIENSYGGWEHSAVC